MKKSSVIKLSRRQMLASATAAIAATSIGCQKEEEAPVAITQKPQPLSRQARLKTPLPKPNGLNLIVIVSDTTRCDHLGLYGSKRVKTPNLDRLASEGVAFENSYADGLPTIPCRRVFHSGRTILHEKTAWWRPMDAEDVTLSEVLQKAGVRTGLIADTYHYFKPDMNFHRGYDSWQWIRGQETDKWISGPRDQFDPSKHMPKHLWNERYQENLLQYIMNTSMRKGEQDYFCAQSCTAAMKWLEQNAREKPFMLWLDMFDPHEPWDAPPRFQKMYRDNYGYERYLFGYGVRNKDILETDYPVLRDLYAAEVTFSDYWIGRLLEKIDSLKLRDDTIVVFASDHGTHLGELNCVQKTAGLLNSCVAHIPLIVRHPEKKYAGMRVKEFVSAVDYMPTFLAMLGITEFPGLAGKDFWRMAITEGRENYQRVFMGFGNFGAVRDKKWHYFQNFRGKDTGKGPALYDLESDPNETKNVISEYPDVVAERQALLAERFETTLPGTQKA
jgi:arylsulfatase A-like enzyme